jgi:hypothetical protein
MSTAPAPFLLPAGYLIVVDAAEYSQNTYLKNAGRVYCGVDRRPALIAPDPAIRDELGLPRVQDKDLAEALDQWFDALNPPPAFIRQARTAFRWFDTFVRHGHNLELVFCDLAWSTGEEDRLTRYPAWEEERPATAITYGYDVSWPTANHSAIFQPGVVDRNPSWQSRLNKWGLLDNYVDAAHLREDYLNVYPYPPFDIYIVHKVRLQ